MLAKATQGNRHFTWAEQIEVFIIQALVYRFLMQANLLGLPVKFSLVLIYLYWADQSREASAGKPSRPEIIKLLTQPKPL